MTGFEMLLLGGLVILSFALFTCQWFWLRKLGVVTLLGSSALLGWFLSGSIIVAIGAAALWLLLPWIEILTRIRHIRIPVERQLRPKNPPDIEMEPSLEELTREFENAHFESVDDVGWQWENFQQFFRLLSHPRERCHALLSIAEQGQVAFFYMGVTSRTKDGRLWTTWTYPFSNGLKRMPRLRVQRLAGHVSVSELMMKHREFLERNGVETDDLVEPPADALPEAMQTELQDQIRHNLKAGLLVESDDGNIRYTWRGLCFVWWQAVCDLVRLS